MLVAVVIVIFIINLFLAKDLDFLILMRNYPTRLLPSEEWYNKGAYFTESLLTLKINLCPCDG